MSLEQALNPLQKRSADSKMTLAAPFFFFPLKEFRKFCAKDALLLFGKKLTSQGK